MNFGNLRILALLAPLAGVPACKSESPTVAPAPACPICPACNAPDAVAARIGAETITVAEVDKRVGQEVFDVRQKALDRLIIERVVAPEAKKAGVTVQIYIGNQVAERVPPVSEAEAAKFFEGNKGILPPELAAKSFADAKGDIIEGLTGQKRQQEAEKLLGELRVKAGVKVLLEAPKVQVAAIGPSRGPANAKVTIVEFSDFECPFCDRGRQMIDLVMKKYPDQVRVVFRDYPLPFHAHAKKAAEAGLCAHDQGKFWPLHDWMFTHQSQLAPEELQKAARQLGIDGTKFDTCLSSGKHAATVAENTRAGEEAGVTGTPAFFVNGSVLSGAQPFDKFKDIIDRALAQ